MYQVSSESGWSPNPELLARRQFVRTKWGWFPKEDAFGGGELSSIIFVCLFCCLFCLDQKKKMLVFDLHLLYND